jgi:hypothetical protein
MYVFLGLLILLLVYHLQDKEGFTIHIEGGMDVMTPIQETFQTVTNGVHHNILRPTYSTLMGFIPYKHHYRKLRRHFK